MHPDIPSHSPRVPPANPATHDDDDDPDHPPAAVRKVAHLLCEPEVAPVRKRARVDTVPPLPARRVKFYQNAAPSSHCHVCARTANNVRFAVCARLAVGLCRKVTCNKCFARFGWDWSAAISNPSWICPHCRGTCPPGRSQCFIYARVNRRRETKRAARAAAAEAAAKSSASQTPRVLPPLFGPTPLPNPAHGSRLSLRDNRSTSSPGDRRLITATIEPSDVNVLDVTGAEHVAYPLTRSQSEFSVYDVGNSLQTSSSTSLNPLQPGRETSAASKRDDPLLYLPSVRNGQNCPHFHSPLHQPTTTSLPFVRLPSYQELHTSRSLPSELSPLDSTPLPLRSTQLEGLLPISSTAADKSDRQLCSLTPSRALQALHVMPLPTLLHGRQRPMSTLAQISSDSERDYYVPSSAPYRLNSNK